MSSGSVSLRPAVWQLDRITKMFIDCALTVNNTTIVLELFTPG